MAAFLAVDSEHAIPPHKRPLFIEDPGVALLDRFCEDALAPAVAGIVRCLSRVRIDLIRRYEVLSAGSAIRLPKASPARLPRYSGAGETSIHKAIREAERLLQGDQKEQAFRLLADIADDLHRAWETKQIVPLMEKWNARFPSELPVDLMEADVAQLLAYVDRLIEAEPEDDEFTERLRDAAEFAVEEYMKAHGYDSPREAIRDLFDSAGQETSFEVQLPESLQRLIGRTSLQVTVPGLPTVSNVVYELESRFPALRDARWVLLVDGRHFRSTGQLLLPGQKLELIIPDSPGQVDTGSNNPMAAFIPVALLGPAPFSTFLIDAVAVVGLVIHAVSFDWQFFARAAQRRLRAIAA